MSAPADLQIAPIQCWDSCLFIAFLTGEPKRAQIVRELLKRAKAGSLTIAISELVVAEVRPARPSHSSAERKVIEDLLGADHPFMRFFAVTHQIARLARDIGSQQPSLTVPDTVHIATALVAKADVFYTFDGDHEKKARRSGDLLRWDKTFGAPPLRIEAPAIDFGPLFTSEGRQLQPGGESSAERPAQGST